jgi:hypothetical protein
MLFINKLVVVYLDIWSNQTEWWCIGMVGWQEMTCTVFHRAKVLRFN